MRQNDKQKGPRPTPPPRGATERDFNFEGLAGGRRREAATSSGLDYGVSIASRRRRAGLRTEWRRVVHALRNTHKVLSLSLILRLLVPPSLRRARVSGLGTRFRVCDESLPHSEVRVCRIYTLHGA